MSRLCRALLEVEVVHQLRDCPQILQLHTSFREESRFFTVFQRVEGGTMREFLDKSGPLTGREVMHQLMLFACLNMIFKNTLEFHSFNNKFFLIFIFSTILLIAFLLFSIFI